MTYLGNTESQSDLSYALKQYIQYWKHDPLDSLKINTIFIIPPLVIAGLIAKYGFHKSFIKYGLIAGIPIGTLFTISMSA
ncbi:MAG: hypothetical protein KKD48_01950 [Nanoarchaeota archaeon]|nr:hypothetical protein [Nanoarchaeota archaeon]